jgi:Peptidase A4 family
LLKRALLAVGGLLTALNVSLIAVGMPGPPLPLLVHSSNWSGYAAVGSAGQFTSVSAEWRVPSVNCALDPEAYSAQWVGLDGFNDKTVEQLGTEADCYYGVPVYGAWFEMYPAYPTVAHISVRPGDLISASVHGSDGSYHLVITDLTTGKSASRTGKCGSSCERSSAEVISEAPSSDYGTLPLADFGSVQFSDVQVNSASLLSPNWKTYEIVQRQDGAILQQPSALNGDGFAVTWKGSGE